MTNPDGTRYQFPALIRAQGFRFGSTIHEPAQGQM